jgi:hypothetical protein
LGGSAPIITIPKGGFSSPFGAVATPETARPHVPDGALGGANAARTFVLGNGNHTTQIQLGSGDVSNLGILGGNNNDVSVLQGGNSLRSNLVLLNAQGLDVGVIQPKGSGPVNALIARLPNGSLLIKR